jgi:hypothetical protein
MRGSFEGLDSSTGSSLFLTEKKRVIGWNNIIGEHDSTINHRTQKKDQWDEDEDTLRDGDTSKEVEDEDVTVRKCKS